MGDDLLSHRVSPAVPSALAGLTSLFGMGRGVAPPPSSPFLKKGVFGCKDRAPDLWKLHSATKPLSPRLISTTRLKTSLHLHLWPINLVVYQESYSLKGDGRPYLEASFPLRCFQRLSLPYIATRRCPWQDNRYTRGTSTPVLSYWESLLSNLQRQRKIGTELSHDV